MGRLIDIDKARKEYSNLTDLTMSDTTLLLTLFGVLDNAPTVEAIPKTDYENRLKADMAAMLTEIQLECEENTFRWYVGRVDGKSDDVVLMETLNDIIQQKINALKGDSDGA